MLTEEGASIAKVGAGHVGFSEGAFVVCEFPLAEEAEGAHCEGEDRGHGWGGREEGGGVEDCAIAAEGGDKVGFLVEGG